MEMRVMSEQVEGISECGAHEDHFACYRRDTPPTRREDWRVERCTHIGDHFAVQVAIEGEADVEVVYETMFQAQVWQKSRESADQMWPRLIDHLRANAKS